MNTNKKPRTLACLYCNKSHKKCDGNRPCLNCKENKIDCVENTQRKAIGRPKKRPFEYNDQMIHQSYSNIPKSFNGNSLSVSSVTSLSFGEGNPQYLVTPNNSESKPFNFLAMDSNHQMCPSCNTKQLDSAKFCNQCGNKLITDSNATIEDLKRQIEKLKRKNEYLTNTMKIKEVTSGPEYNMGPMMWALFKFKSGEFKKQIPLPVYILKTSYAFKKLLGYDDLLNKYLPDLVPKEYHKIFDCDATPKFKDVPPNALPKLTCNSRIVYKHFDGHYIDAQVNTDIYFDPISKSPSFGMIVVENVWPHQPSAQTIPSEMESTCTNDVDQIDQMDHQMDQMDQIDSFDGSNMDYINSNIDNNSEFISSESPDTKSFLSLQPSPPINFFEEFNNVSSLLDTKDSSFLPQDPFTFNGFELDF